MEINTYRDRIMYLAGALDEARKMFQEAMKEIDNASQKQSNGTSEPIATSENKSISNG